MNNESSTRTQVSLPAPLDVRLPGRLVEKSEPGTKDGLLSWFAAVELDPEQEGSFLAEVAGQLLGKNYDVNMSSTGLFATLNSDPQAASSDLISPSGQAWVRVTLTVADGPGAPLFAAVSFVERAN